MQDKNVCGLSKSRPLFSVTTPCLINAEGWGNSHRIMHVRPWTKAARLGNGPHSEIEGWGGLGAALVGRHACGGSIKTKETKTHNNNLTDTGTRTETCIAGSLDLGT